MMDERRERMGSDNPPTFEELLAFANRIEKMRDAEEAGGATIEYCQQLSCYLMAHLNPLGDNQMTLMPLVAALRVVEESLENAAKDDNPFFEMTNRALSRLILKNSETVTIKIPVKKED